jgi:outer membrane protein assembly factor BamB
MTSLIASPSFRTPLRLWPGVTLAALQPLLWFAVPALFPEAGFVGVLGTLVCALGIMLWWLFFSRALWKERLSFLLLAAVAVSATARVLHISIATAGMGVLYFFYVVPLLTFLFALTVAATRGLADGPRRAALAVTILLASGSWALLRTDGIGGSGLDLAWRWSPTPEQRLLAQAKDEPASPAPPPAPAAAVAAEPEEGQSPARVSEERPEPAPASVAALPAPAWPGFRGPHRDSVIPWARIETNWATSPPVELWRRAVGPAWSSFAVQGDRIYTQEQRGEEEVVACYSLTTGQPVWMHRDATRFWEANAGPGPRGTPTLHLGRVYTFGATGIVNALDAATGAVVWSRNAASDADVKVPYWGFASSPLVAGDTLIVAVSGRLIAYDIATGTPRWLGPAGAGGYSSPHLVTIAGIKQVLLVSEGAISLAPADGAVLWQYKWSGAGMLQPALTADGDLLLTTADMNGGVGIRRISVTHGPEGWTVTERWTTRGLKPYFNDFVVHKGHAYGFDGAILSCIHLENGERKWKGGRYGNGQMLLLPAQDVLLVLSEEGEIALVSATPDKYAELARFPALAGKTWNHPALVGNILLVRNDREMAAFRLPAAR